MRWSTLIAAATLGGCANTTDLGNAFSVTVTAFGSGITTANQLEVDLQKDFLRKSEQLEYVSKGSYSCGSPTNPEIVSIEKKARQSILKVRGDALKSLRSKNAYINAILGYGDTIAATVKHQADLGSTLDKWSTAVGSLAGIAATPEATLFAAVSKSIISDIKAVSGYVSHEQIKEIAIRIRPHLTANVAYLIKTRNLRDLTANEETAYQLWNSCAKERLRFVQKFYPPTFGKEQANPYPSIAPSPVWDFMNAYGEYISEREAFLARKPDFASLLQLIVKANDAIIADAADFVDVANALIATAAAIQTSSDGIRKATETYANAQ